MKSVHPHGHSTLYRLLYCCTAAALSAVVFFIFMYKPGVNGKGCARIPDMVHGTACKPFVYRALLPAAVRLAVWPVPGEAKARLNRFIADSEAGRESTNMFGLDPQHLTMDLVAVVLMYLSLWGFVWALAYLLAAVYRVSTQVRRVTLLAAVGGLLVFVGPFNYLYDFPALFLFTLGLALMARSKWALYLVIYLLGCLNKETTILLTVAFVVHFGTRRDMERRLFGRLLAIQLLIFVALKGALAAVFWNNPGTFVEFHFLDHNLALLETYPPAHLFAWGGFWLLLSYRWSAKPAFLRHSLWIVPPLVVLTLLLGYLDELRDYYEAYPIVLLLVLHSIGAVVGFEVSPALSRCNGRTPCPVGRRSSDKD